MQVNKINSMNTFRGLWQNTDKTVGRVRQTGSQIIEREAVYRPFKDEEPQQIAKAMLNAEAGSVWECDDDRVSDPYGPDHYIIVKPTLGQKLNITEAEYKEISKLDTSAKPETRYPLYYTPSSYVPDEVKEKI